MSERLTLDEPHRRFTAEEVMRMVQAGILGEDDRLELIGGELLLMSPQDPAHAAIVSRLTRLLLQGYPQGFCVRVQLPLAATASDLLEPDLVIARGTESTYGNRHPSGSDWYS
jgi:Uma2 family endonuclease